LNSNNTNNNRPECWYYGVCSNAGYKEDCRNGCIKYLEMKNLMETSGLPKSKQQLIKLYLSEDSPDIEAFKQLEDIRKDMWNFVNEGRNLYICGTHVGNGKTSWAIKLLHRYFQEVWEGNALKVRGKFVRVSDVLLKLKDFNSPMAKHEKQILYDCDLVVWDDIATGYMTNYDYMNIFDILDYRQLAEKSNIFTSNIESRDDLAEKVSDKLASRVWDTSTIIKLTGGSYRGQSTNNK